MKETDVDEKDTTGLDSWVVDVVFAFALDAVWSNAVLSQEGATVTGAVAGIRGGTACTPRGVIPW